MEKAIIAAVVGLVLLGFLMPMADAIGSNMRLIACHLTGAEVCVIE